MTVNPRFVLTTHQGTDLQLNVNLQELGVGNDCTFQLHCRLLPYLYFAAHVYQTAQWVVCLANVTSLLSILLKYPVCKISEMRCVHRCECVQPLETSIQQLDVTQVVDITENIPCWWWRLPKYLAILCQLEIWDTEKHIHETYSWNSSCQKVALHVPAGAVK
jgi:hypothetical protein